MAVPTCVVLTPQTALASPGPTDRIKDVPGSSLFLRGRGLEAQAPPPDSHCSELANVHSCFQSVVVL
ncbi:unnamed protein product [Gadus morhua 'NCC']